MIAVIDNFDSFTYNLVQYIGEILPELEVFRNNTITPDDLFALKPSHIVVSPGPRTPSEAGISVAVIQNLPSGIPLLGVCLGHQSIGQAFGGRVIRCAAVMHGKTSTIRFQDSPLFKKVPNPFTATRYHSLIVDKQGFPDDLKIIAETEDGIIMGIEHRDRPIFGIQFHPESILTKPGKQIIRNFLSIGDTKNV